MRSILEKRELALHAFKAGIEAANPELVVRQHLQAWLKSHDLSPKSVIPIAVGKAAVPLMKGMLSLLPKEGLKRAGLVITNRENLSEVSGAEVYPAGHPLPDQAGQEATLKLISVLEQAEEGDHIFFAVSGGASAMLPAPRDGISLQDKIETTNLLLASGADISAMNVVRKHLSKVKGGGVVSLSAPASITSFVLSDVVGDDLSTIASGPSVADPSSFSDMQDILKKYEVMDQLPDSIRKLLRDGLAGEIPETLKPGAPSLDLVENILIGSNVMSVTAVKSYLEQHGIEVLPTTYPLEGNAREEAKSLVEWLSKSSNDEKKTVALVTGGETTVRLVGDGIGGRNQEFALTFALEAEEAQLGSEWVFLSGGTDGRDGPCDAAGGLVDAESLGRLKVASIDFQAELARNNSYDVLKASGDLLMTGGTGTNVADIQIFLH